MERSRRTGDIHRSAGNQAYEAIAETLEAGGVVGLFPEGRLTQNGRMGPFMAGIEWIVRTPTPVIPMALTGLWGTFLSRFNGGRR